MTQPPESVRPLAGRRAVITGGTTGIGRAIACQLAAAGCRVFICGRDPGHLADALRDVQACGAEAGGVPADLSTVTGIETFFAEADAFLGELDIAVLNAGVGSKGELADMDPLHCRHVVDVNLNACIGSALEAARRMRGRGGHIVMTGSMSAQVWDERSSVYVATKAGVRGFAGSFRKEANPQGIHVTLIEPGCTASDMVDESLERQHRMQEDGHMLRADDVARAVLCVVQQPERCDVVTLQLRPRLQLI